MPFFSVVIPLYNKANFIQQTLDSVLWQTFQDFEVIIIDDGSTDNSIKVVKQFKDQRIKCFHQSNKGASQARNYGVELSNSNWIALLDADDIWYKDHLFQLKETIIQLPKAHVVSNAYEIQLHHNFVKQPSYSKTFPSKRFYVDDYFEYSCVDSLFWTSSIAFQKQIFDDIGGFDVTLNTGQDLDLFIRFALGYCLGYNSKITLRYNNVTENNLSKTIGLNEKFKYIKKHKTSEKFNPSLKTYLDVNRFSLALQAKQSKDKQLFQEVVKELDKRQLSSKKRFLLNLPSWVLIVLKKIQAKLIRFGVYKSAFN